MATETSRPQTERSNMSDMADFNPLSKEQEEVVLLLELNRLRKKGAISLETFVNTMKEWEL